MNLCLVLLLSSTAYDRLLRSPVSCAHLRVACTGCTEKNGGCTPKTQIACTKIACCNTYGHRL